MRYLILLLVVLACTNPTAQEGSSTEYTIQYTGTCSFYFTVFYYNPESGETGQHGGSGGDDWHTAEFTAHSGQLLWCRLITDGEHIAQIIVDGEVWKEATGIDTIYVETLLP